MILQAKRFAQAVFEIARERNDLDQWLHDLERIAALAQNADVVSVLENPKFGFENKKKLLDSQLQGIHPLAKNMAYILTGRGCFHHVSKIHDEYEQFLNDFRGIAKAEITTAVPIDAEERQKIAERLRKITGKKVVMLEKVSPEIIGGMIARIEGKIIDGSTRTQLDALKSRLGSARG